MNPSELQLGTITHPRSQGSRVEFFRTREKAVNHLRDHLLTAPECNAWALLQPRIRDWVDPEDQESRQDAMAAARASQGKAAQPLLDLYRQSAEEAAQEANRLGWHAQEEDVTVAFGLQGLVLILEGDFLLTAYIPGMGESFGTIMARTVAFDSPLPRERGMRPGLASTRENRRRQRREAERGEVERIYYEVFRPAVQHIRKEYHRSMGLDGQPRRRDIALLKRVLPPMSQLGYETWVSMRVQRIPEGVPCPV